MGWREETHFTVEREARFWAKVDRSEPDGCWPWMNAKTESGYGVFAYTGGRFIASRLSWAIANGRLIAPGLHACHHCDNPPCVQPSHLFEGTRSDNMRDMVNKGRGRWKGLCGRGHDMDAPGNRAYYNGVPNGCARCHAERNADIRADRVSGGGRNIGPDGLHTKCVYGHDLTLPGARIYQCPSMPHGCCAACEPRRQAAKRTGPKRPLLKCLHGHDLTTPESRTAPTPSRPHGDCVQCRENRKAAARALAAARRAARCQDNE